RTPSCEITCSRGAAGAVSGGGGGSRARNPYRSLAVGCAFCKPMWDRTRLASADARAVRGGTTAPGVATLRVNAGPLEKGALSNPGGVSATEGLLGQHRRTGGIE